MSDNVYGGDEVGALIFDIGSNFLRIGYAGDDLPKAYIPTMAGVVEENLSPISGAVEVNGNSSLSEYSYVKKYFIDTTSIHVTREGMEMETFLKDGMIENWEQLEQVIDYVYDKHIRSEPNMLPVLMSEASWNVKPKREKLTEVMFEKYNIPAFFLCKNAVLAAYSQCRKSCLVLDSGYSQTSVVPVIDGYVLSKAILKSPRGGDFLNMQCKQFLEENHVEVVPTYMIESKEAVNANVPAKWVKKSNLPEVTTSWHTFMQNQVIEDFKRSVLEVCETQLTDEVAKDLPSVHYEYPNGFNQDIGIERFQIAEKMFNPNNNVIEIPEITFGAAKMVTTSVGKCDIDARPLLCGSVVLTGGNTLLNGFRERLTKELVSLNRQGMKYKVVPSNDTDEQKFGAWIGGSILASLGTFQSLWISKQEFTDKGKGIIHKRCP